MGELDPQHIQVEESASVASVEEVADGRRWYIIQCYSAQEYKVETRIHQMVLDRQLGDRVFRVLVPEEETIEIKNNKRLEKTTKIFPGYLFVQMILDESLYYDLRNIMGVSKFVGTKTHPTPVTEEEILKVLRKVGDKTKKIDVDFEEGEVIKVISGPFRGYSGPISEINVDRGTLKALISIFGRETPVKLDFDQVEKAVE
jgi:transcription termination/antitermination protein NusG